MPRKGSKRKKKQNNSKKKSVNETQPEQASTPREPTRVDPAIERKLAELQADYDLAITNGRSLLEKGDLAEAKVKEQEARKYLKASKKLNGVTPIAPGAVRALARDIMERETNALANQAKQLYHLASKADAKLDEIRKKVTIRGFRGTEVIAGDLALGLEMISKVDSRIVAVRAAEFAELKERLESAIRRQDQAKAGELYRRITQSMRRDTEAAIRLVNELERDYPSFYNIDELRSKIEGHREAAEKYQRERAEAAATKRAKQEAHERKLKEDQALARLRREADEAYGKIVGSHQHKIKPGQAIRNLRDAHRRDPQGLAALIQIARTPYTTYEMEIERLEGMKEYRSKVWSGYRELEWIEAASTGEQVVDRLVEACQREYLDWIRDRKDWWRRMVDACYSHRDLIYLKVVELLNKECPKCLEVATWLADFAFFTNPYGRSQCYYTPDVDLYELFDEASYPEPQELCDKKAHAPKREPWNRRRKSNKRGPTSK